MNLKPQNGIRVFALICVAVTSIYIMWMGYLLNDVLAGPKWCQTALGAEKASSTDGTIKGLDGCMQLLTIQLKSLATNSHILFGVVALCLLVLIVVVIAQARLELKGPGGFEGATGPATPVTVVNEPENPVPVKEPKP
jgi:hypothetical protein